MTRPKSVRPGPVALYIQIADDIRNEFIADSPHGTRLPGELQLVSRYGVSRVTVRQAVSVLEEEGLVVRKQGLGTFTSRRRAELSLAGVTRFRELLAESGFDTQIDVIDEAEVQVPPDLAELFPHDTHLIRARRIVRAERRPVALVDAHSSAVALNHAASRHTYALDPGASYPQLTIDRAAYRIGLDTADEERAARLGIDVGSPMLASYRIGYRSGEIVEASNLFMIGELGEFVVETSTTPGSASIATALRALGQV